MIFVIYFVVGMIVGATVVTSVFIGVAKYVDWKRKQEMLPYQKYKMQIDKYKK